MTGRFKKKAIHKIGMPAGTLLHVGEKRADQTRITVLDFSPDRLREETSSVFDPKHFLREPSGVIWVNLDGLHDIQTVENLGQYFNVHPLVLEDVLNTRQRPKAEEYDGYMFVVMKMLWPEKETGRIMAEQVSLIWGDGFLISFQELPQDVFDQVRERIRKGRGRLRNAGSEYLAYALMDAVVDHYFPVLDTFSDQLEDVEADLTDADPEPRLLTRIHELRRETIFIRRQIWPVREIVSVVAKANEPLMTRETEMFLRDVLDHAIQTSDMVETLRETTVSLQDLYLALAGHRMNEIMKILTIMAAVFIPLTFIAGVYGMNFRFMPELSWPWGYPAVWIVMLAVACCLLIYFKRKKWL